MRLSIVLTTIVLASIPTGISQGQTTHTCFGEPATVVGTSGDDDDLFRGPDDVVVGLGGVDEVSGRLACGNKGDDRWVSGYMVDAGPGNDDEVRLRGDGVLAIGGSGNDDFVDDDGDQRQVWRGGAGHDRFTPAAGDDVFYGGTGMDSIGGGEPGWSDKLRLFGGADNDTLSGGTSKDKIYGEDGDDTLSVAHDDGGIEDLVDGGPGFDTCTITAGDRAVNCEDVTSLG